MTDTVNKAKDKNASAARTRLIIRPLKGCLYCFIITVITSGLVTLFDSLIPQLLRFTVDSLIGDSEPDLPAFMMKILTGLGGVEFLRSRFFIVAVAVIVTALLSALFTYITRVYNSKGSELYAESMRNELFKKIDHLPFTWHGKNNTGDIIQRCTSDVETVRNFVSTQLIELFRVIIIVVIASVMMFSIDVRIAAAAFAFLPFVALYSIIFHLKISSKFKEADESEGVLSTVAQENLTGVRVVRAFGRERYERDNFNKANVRYADLWAQLGKIMSIFWALSDVVACMQMLTVLVLCAFYAVDGSITAGDCYAFVYYTSMLSWPVRSLGRVVSEMSKSSVSVDRLAYILDSETEDYNTRGKDVDFSGDIEFKDVSFAYHTDKDNINVLNGLSFKVKAGETLGVIGGTGSGKSTVAALLCRLYDLKRDDADSSGDITIGGVSVSDIGLENLRSNIGIVLQEPFLFSRTIGENIAITEDGAPDENRIVNAARVACVDDAINEFSQGYATVVGERGVTLSGGQKQRVAIARTLYKRTPIVIFDDSLSAVDTETDAKIRTALRDELGGATVIIITHRVTSLMSADKILVLDKGKAAQFGTHKELSTTDGIYREIYNIQQAGAAEAAAIAAQSK